MQKLDILRDGPFRYVHSTATGELLTTLVREQSGRFREEDCGDKVLTLRQWKAVLARSVDESQLDTSRL